MVGRMIVVTSIVMFRRDLWKNEAGRSAWARGWW